MGVDVVDEGDEGGAAEAFALEGRVGDHDFEFAADCYWCVWVAG